VVILRVVFVLDRISFVHIESNHAGHCALCDLFLPNFVGSAEHYLNYSEFIRIRHVQLQVVFGVLLECEFLRPVLEELLVIQMIASCCLVSPFALNNGVLGILEFLDFYWLG
jgi:hypothetical protein